MPRSTPAPKATPAELGILKLLWAQGPATVKQVHELWRQERRDVTYANVLRLMQIMHGKGLLTRDESERSHVYAAAQEQQKLQTHLLRELIHKAFAGSGRDLVMAALRGHVSEAERAEIQKYLKETRRE